MRRYTEDELRRLKEEVDLAEIVRAAGVELKQIGQDLRGRCPFHDDQGPSLVVTPAKNLWHCLGACGAGGSVIDWVMKAQGVSFRHAVELLRAKPPALGAGPVGARRSTVKRLPPPVALEADDQKLLNQVVVFYHETLKRESAGLAYLKKRGLESSEMVERFKLGYSNRTLGYRLPGSAWKAGAELRGRLEKIGIYRGSGHEHFSGCLVIPIQDEHGNVQGVYGRKVCERLQPEIPRHLYLKGPHKGVWNVEALQAAKEVILCEALIDALTFWSAGYRNVTASYGTQGFTSDHLEAFQRHGTEKVLIAYDRDEAGDKAAAELAPKLAEAGMEVYRVLFPKGMDANEYARKVTPAAESLGVVLRAAPLVVKGKRSTPAPAAAPEPISPAETLAPLAAPSPLRVQGDHAELSLGDRLYRVRGVGKSPAAGERRLVLRASRGEKVHVDTIDLLSARQRAQYVKEAADELGLKPEVVKHDLGKLLLELESEEERRLAAGPRPREIQISDLERREAMAFLQDPRLLDRVGEAFDRIGLVGEETNKLVGYLAAVSRKMDEPLAVLIQSNSAAGKSALMDAILELCPEEDVERYTAMTGQSLYYMAGADLKHKVLAIAEAEGAERAGYAIKMLQSEGRISIATTVKDPETGEMKTKRHDVEGPVAVMLTTTAAALDEELQNRAVVLTVNEDRSQTRAIHERQRRAQTLEGMLARQDREQVVRLHRNAQRLLRPILVVNPFAERLSFLDTKLRTRRDHVKYLTLIRAVAFVHQVQRPVKHIEHRGKLVPYIEATVEDLRVANALAAEVLGRSLDELAPPTRRLLLEIDRMVAGRCRKLGVDRAEYRFTRRDVREETGWGHSQLGTHLGRLVDLEYLLVHRGGRGQSFVYELLYDGGGQEGGRFLVGLIDPERLASLYGADLPGSGGEFPGSIRPPSGPFPGGVGERETAPNAPAEAVHAEIHDSAAGTQGYGTPSPKAVVHEEAAGG
jgi:DNA primase catalytic core